MEAASLPAMEGVVEAKAKAEVCKRAKLSCTSPGYLLKQSILKLSIQAARMEGEEALPAMAEEVCFLPREMGCHFGTVTPLSLSVCQQLR